MFWRKKSDGFDWHKHVRTTIKLRREARKKRVNDAVDLAVGGVKGVGKAGASASAASLDAVSRGIGAPFVWLSRGLGSGLSALSSGLSKAFAPAGRLTERRGVAPMLGLAGAIAGLLGLARARVEGWDVIALALGLGGLALLALLVGPPLFSGRGPASMRKAADALTGLLERLPAFTRVSVTAQRAITASLVLAAVAGTGWLGAQAIGRLPASTLAAIPGLSRPPVEGMAAAISGDTLRINGQAIRLSGVEAPLIEQMCGERQGRERRFRCGEAALKELRELVRGKPVTCELGSTDARGTRLATCRAGTTDLAADLVTRGHIFAEAGLFAAYGRQEQDARNARRGIWKGTVERPEEFRARHIQAAAKSAPGGCTIKGRVQRGEKIYVVPWSNAYRGTRVREDRGERWFCSEAEAIAAGWRAPGDRSSAVTRVVAR